MMQQRKTPYNRRLAQWQVTWLIEHSSSRRLLWCINSLVLRLAARKQSPKPLGESSRMKIK